MSVEINIEEISAQVDSLSIEELKKQVLDAKVKQRVATKKYYNADAAKVQRQKRAATIKAAEEKLKSLGLYDSLMEEVKVTADAKLAEDAEDTAGEEAAG